MEDAQALLETAFKEYLAGIGDRDPSLDEVPVDVAWQIAEHVAARTVARLGCEKGTQSHPPNLYAIGGIMAAEQAFRGSLEMGFDFDSVDMSDKEMTEVGRDAAREAISYFRWHQALAPYLTDGEVEERRADPDWKAGPLAESGDLLAMPGPSGIWYFPDWQFEPGTAELRKATHAILEKFHRRQIRNVTAAVISWAATPQPELNGHSPREVISDSSQEAAILTSADSLARRLES
ncbi:hypothetical protein ACIBG6_05875 [Streptomyces sp. NPDC050842]|uniref:hypothetical protein n=1 Tax=Streptomyces sp. NPDC050842 TaxID=3365636 RepID=UPI0037A3670E